MPVLRPAEPDVSGMEPIVPGHGETPATLQHWAATGDIVQIAGEVFLPRDMMRHRSLRVAALAAVVPAHAVVTGTAAAWIWGGPLMPRVHVLLPPGTSRRVCAGVQATQDGRILWAEVDRFPVDAESHLLVTSPALTALEIMTHEDGLKGAGDALDWLLHHLVDPSSIEALLAQRKRYPGACELRTRVARAVREAQSGCSPATAGDVVVPVIR